jgi:hypothetical protein
LSHPTAAEQFCRCIHSVHRWKSLVCLIRLYRFSMSRASITTALPPDMSNSIWAASHGTTDISPFHFLFIICVRVDMFPCSEYIAREYLNRVTVMLPWEKVRFSPGYDDKWTNQMNPEWYLLNMETSADRFPEIGGMWNDDVRGPRQSNVGPLVAIIKPTRNNRTIAAPPWNWLTARALGVLPGMDWINDRVVEFLIPWNSPKEQSPNRADFLEDTASGFSFRNLKDFA